MYRDSAQSIVGHIINVHYLYHYYNCVWRVSSGHGSLSAGCDRQGVSKNCGEAPPSPPCAGKGKGGPHYLYTYFYLILFQATLMGFFVFCFFARFLFCLLLFFVFPKGGRGISDVPPPPVWNIRASSLIPLFSIYSLVLLPSPVAISVLSFSAFGRSPDLVSP